ncbi:hypothetical protein ACNKHX_05815 [Shigella flexneri]
MTAVTQIALRNLVAVGEQEGNWDLSAVMRVLTRQNVRAVQVIGDAAKALGFALGAEASPDHRALERRTSAAWSFINDESVKRSGKLLMTSAPSSSFQAVHGSSLI